MCALQSELDALGVIELATYRKDARIRNLKFSLSREEFKNIIFKNCHYCNDIPSTLAINKSKNPTSILYNGIDRINNEIGYELTNCVPCCTDCNI